MEREIPAHDILELAAKRTRYCVCIPVINEGDRIRKQLREMLPLASVADVIIADGGSTDGSTAESELRRAGVRTLLIKRGPGRLGAQLRMGFSYALDQRYDGVVLMDGNGKDDPEAIPRFIGALEAGSDFVQGSRFLPGGEAIHNPASRLLGIRLLHAPLISWSAGVRYTDTTNGFRAYSSRFLADPRVALFRDIFAGYELHYYLSIKAGQLEFKVTEIPVRRIYPKEGKTPTKISFFKGNMDVMRCLLRACLHKYDPDI